MDATFAGARHSREAAAGAAWAADPTRIPYRLLTDPGVYGAEQARIFRGPFWGYLALEAEVPEPGDFVTTFLGDTPVVVQRDADGDVAAFVNRCAHRGALVCREPWGNTATHTCVYHQWRYDGRGRLRSVPYARGVRGQGGYPDDFDLRRHDLTPLSVARYGGVVFGCLAEPRETLSDYLGPLVRRQLDRVFTRPLRILGYQRQLIRANWKLYLENTKDPYHAGLLHYFFPFLGILKATMPGFVLFDEHGRHTLLASAREAADRAGAGATEAAARGFRLHDESLLAWRREFDDLIVNFILSIFPNVVVQQILNSLAVRHTQPKAANEFVLQWTYFGYADDHPELTRQRLVQSNLLGPAGLVSLEDAEAMELVQRAIERGPEGASVIELDGRDVADAHHLVTEVGLRGFWRYYARVMGADPGEGRGA